MKTIKQYILENYEPAEIKEINEHGCSGGSASTLIYYTETCAFHDEYEAEIWEILYECAEECGTTTMEFIAELNGQKHVDSIDQLKNLLTWFAVEHVCYAIQCELEEHTA